MTPKKPRLWLVKSEPGEFSWQDLVASPKRRTHWDGIRNYQVRNFIRDDMKVGDRVLYYHSNAKPPGVVGTAKVVKEAYPDPTQFDPRHKKFDQRSKPEDPAWLMFDLDADTELAHFVSLQELKDNPKLAKMLVVQRGQRLSIQPVTRAEWDEVLRMGAASSQSQAKKPAPKEPKKMPAETVAAYLDSLPADRKPAMKKLRAVIKKNLPKGFKEGINYKMIGWFVPHTRYPDGYHCDPKQPLPFLNLASQKQYIALYHMGIYADPKLLAWFKQEWPKHVDTKLDMGKSCIRFKKVENIPYELIGELVAKMSPDDWIKLYERSVK